MPRITYAHRLEVLASKPLSDFDKGFVESLSNYYSRKRSLTAGRAAAVKRLEERYSDENLAQAAANPLNERLKSIATRIPSGTWDEGFVASLTNQTLRNQPLSDKQLMILAKIEGRFTDEAIAAAQNWKTTYTNSDELKLKAKIVANYYITTGYYHDISYNILEDPEFIPTEKQYKSITGNKYATKILNAWYAEPKYATGSYVYFRDTAPGALRRGTKGPCVVLKVNAIYPKCAAKGTKVYQVLPFGTPAPVFAEERYLKNARIGGAK